MMVPLSAKLAISSLVSSGHVPGVEETAVASGVMTCTSVDGDSDTAFTAALSADSGVATVAAAAGTNPVLFNDAELPWVRTMVGSTRDLASSRRKARNSLSDSFPSSSASNLWA